MLTTLTDMLTNTDSEIENAVVAAVSSLSMIYVEMKEGLSCSY